MNRSHFPRSSLSEYASEESSSSPSLPRLPLPHQTTMKKQTSHGENSLETFSCSPPPCALPSTWCSSRSSCISPSASSSSTASSASSASPSFSSTGLFFSSQTKSVGRSSASHPALPSSPCFSPTRSSACCSTTRSISASSSSPRSSCGSLCSSLSRSPSSSTSSPCRWPSISSRSQ